MFQAADTIYIYIYVDRYYRPCEVPETVYQLLVQDRNTEQGKLNPFFLWEQLHNVEFFLRKQDLISS